MKTAKLVKPKRISDCDDIESEINLFSYSEICSSNKALAYVADFSSPRFQKVRFSNHLHSIKKRCERKREIKFIAFKDTFNSDRRKRLHGLQRI